MSQSPPSDEQRTLEKLRTRSSKALSESPLSKNPDLHSKQEEAQLAYAKRRAELNSTEQDTYERKRYASRTFWLVCCWLAGIAFVIGAQGFRFLGFSLAIRIVLALIGGTTAGVLGIFLIVARYLFRSR